MKTRSTLTKLTITIGLAVMAAAGLFCEAGWLQPVAAQSGDGSVKFISYASTGIIPGEKLRLRVANTEAAAENRFVWVYYTVSNPSGVPLYESERIQVAPGEIRSADVSREDLKTEGEPVTGRAHVLLKLTIIAPAGSNPENFPASFEAIWDGQGAFQPDSKYRLIILAAKRSQQLNAPIGFLPGQSLRYTFLNPDEEGSEAVRVTTFVYDAPGRLVSQTAPAKLEPGQFHTVRINRDDLPMPSEGDQVWLTVFVTIEVQSAVGPGKITKKHLATVGWSGTSDGELIAVPEGSAGVGSDGPVGLLGWVEIVNNRTGGSSSGTYFTGTVTVSDDGF